MASVTVYMLIPKHVLLQLRPLWALAPNTQLPSSHFFWMTHKLSKFNILQIEFIIMLQTKVLSQWFLFQWIILLLPLPTSIPPRYLVQILEVIFHNLFGRSLDVIFSKSLSQAITKPGWLYFFNVTWIYIALILSKSLPLTWILAINQSYEWWVSYELKLSVL